MPRLRKINQTTQRSCEVDESLNYAKYPTFMAIAPDVRHAPSQKPAKRAEGKQVAEPETPTHHRNKAVFFATAALVITLCIAVCITTFTKPEPVDTGTSLPTMRIMAGDCSTLLTDAGLSGAVLELQVQNQELNERFMVLTVTCAVEVLEDGHQKEYVVELLYEYEDDTWHLSSLSNIRQ